MLAFMRWTCRFSPHRCGPLVAVASAGASAAHLAKAIRAVYRFVTAWYKRHFGVLPAVRAHDLCHSALGTAVTTSAAVATTAIIGMTATTMTAAAIAVVVTRSFPCSAAVGAAHGIAVPFLPIKILLALIECKGRTTIAARERLVCHFCFPFPCWVASLMFRLSCGSSEGYRGPASDHALTGEGKCGITEKDAQFTSQIEPYLVYQVTGFCARSLSSRNVKKRRSEYRTTSHGGAAARTGQRV